MKKQLLMLGLGLLGSATMSAQLSSPFTGAQPSAVVGEGADYYLYNVKSGKWLQNNDDHASDPPNNATLWTTRAELGTRGIDWEVTCLALDEYGNYYQLNPKFGSNHSMNASNLYLDTGDPVTQWVLEPADDAGVPNAFRICYNGGAYPYLYVGEDGWIAISEDGYDGENDVWQLVTKEQRLEYMKQQAELNGSADATWLLNAPNFADRDERFNKWIRNISIEGLPDGSHGPAQGHGGQGMMNCNRVYEMWSSYTASISQTVKDLPVGTYGLSVQGYYREGSADHVKDWNGVDLFGYDLWAAGTEHHYATYYANSSSAPLMSIFDGAKDAMETGYEYNAQMTDPEFLDPVESGKWVPNSTDQASYALFYGAYQNGEIKTSVADGTLTIGVKKEQGVNDDWIIVDNFKLTYYGSAIDVDQVKETLAQAIKDAEACTARSTDAINKMFDDALANGKDVYANSSDATAIGSAATAITTAIQLINETSTNANFLKQTVALAQNEKVEGEAMTTAADVAVNGVASDAINSALDNLRMARRLNAADRHENMFKGNVPAAGSFYLYNVGQKRFFCGGEDWGAHAALGFPGIEVTLVATETPDAFVIDTRLRNGETEHYLNYGGYCDTGAQDPWTFEKVSDGVYLIKRTNASEEQVAGGNVYLGYRPGRYATVDTDMGGADVADNHWILVTKADRDALLEAASEENPVDASYLIKMPNFNQREYEITGGWDNLDGQDYAWEHVNGTIYGRGQNKTDFAFECFNQDPLTLTQTIYDMKAGYYILSVQGYYRDCTEVDYTQSIAAGGYEPQQNAKLFAWGDVNMNEVSTKLVTIEKYANYAPGYGWNSNTSVGWIPNDPDQAINYFQVGAYKNSLLVKVGDDGMLSFGIDKKNGGENDWVCVDNFRLTYLGEQTPTGIDGVTDNTEAVKDGKIYNLQGVQVKNATQRGVYIKNGKKFVVK